MASISKRKACIRIRKINILHPRERKYSVTLHSTYLPTYLHPRVSLKAFPSPADDYHKSPFLPAPFLPTTLHRDFPEIIYEPNHPPRRHLQSACEKGAEKRRQRVEHHRKVHEAHINRIMRSYAIEQYDKKMMNDARIKTKMGQTLGRQIDS